MALVDDHELRGVVAGQLEGMSAGPSGPLWSKSKRSTWAAYGDSPARLRFWETLIAEYLDRQSGVSLGGRAALVTAGPPGAGKTTAVDEFLAQTPMPERWRRIDPDLIKEQLISRAIDDGLYESQLRTQLADERPIMPWELAGLVHDESVQVATEIRRRCMREGENLVIEGTLAHAPMVDAHLQEITRHGYDSLHIVSVSVPVDVAQERARQRWWVGRCEEPSGWGGRFMPRAVVAACFSADGLRSRPAENAAELHRRAQRLPGLLVTLTEDASDGEDTLAEAFEQMAPAPDLRVVEDGAGQ